MNINAYSEPRTHAVHVMCTTHFFHHNISRLIHDSRVAYGAACYSLSEPVDSLCDVFNVLGFHLALMKSVS